VHAPCAFGAAAKILSRYCETKRQRRALAECRATVQVISQPRIADQLPQRVAFTWVHAARSTLVFFLHLDLFRPFHLNAINR
jgi:hypothetical protein